MSEEVLPSFNAQLRALRKGESLAKAERFEIGDPPEEGFNGVLSRMRRTVNAAVSKIRETSGSNFRVESGTFITNDNEAIVAAVTVTRQ
jgi:hypothetical protein